MTPFAARLWDVGETLTPRESADPYALVCPMSLSPADSIRRLRRFAVSRLLGLSG